MRLPISVAACEQWSTELSSSLTHLLYKEPASLRTYLD